VFELLRLHKLYCKKSKCEFNRPELKFLGHIVGRLGIAVDPAKVAVVKDWPVPKNVSELRAFLGLCNFFRRFVLGFSKLAGPLTALTGGTAGDDYPWSAWRERELKAFEQLKHALTSAPVLVLPDPNKPYEVWTDASLEGTGGVLLQEGRVVAFTSARLSRAEYNYSTTEQELLAIVRALEQWRCYLEGAAHPVTIVTDHNPLTYLATQPSLSRRLTRWVQFLSRFNHEIVYRPGKGNVADPVSRNPGLALSGDGPDMEEVVGELCLSHAGFVLVLRRKHEADSAGGKRKADADAGTGHPPSAMQGMEPVYEGRRMSPRLLQQLAQRAARLPSVMVKPSGGEGDTAPKRKGRGNRAQKKQKVAARTPDAADAAVNDESDMARGGGEKCGKSDKSGNTGDTSLVDDITAAYAADSAFKPMGKWRQDESGVWLNEDGLIVVPSSPPLRARIISDCHDSAWPGHTGITKTLEKVRRRYWWRTMAADVDQYVRACDACQKNKLSTLMKAGKLRPLPIPSGRWHSVGTDMIVKLPRTPCGYDSILVFIDRLSKMVHLVPTTQSLDAEGFARLFIMHVVRAHGMPRDVVSDRGPQFNNKFWEHVCQRLRLDRKMSSAYHPQTNGQTERINRVIEEMLRSYISPSQRDWHEWLPLVEFAINNSWQESIGCTPFFMNYGEHPLTPADLDLPARVPRAAQFVSDIERHVKLAKRRWAEAQQRVKERVDAKRRSVSYSKGDQVLLSTVNIRWGGADGVRKFMPRWVGPFTVAEVLSPVSVKLQLPKEWARFHRVFHVSLLKPYCTVALDASGKKRDNVVGPPPLQWLDGEPIYEVEKLLQHKEVQRGRKKQVFYLVRWAGYSEEHDTWEPRDNLLTCGQLLKEYKLSHGLHITESDVDSEQ
jgi:hypothetical protein